ncbi:TonB-dependent siderophore receptor [Aliarcobacter butzleri]|uniref:TonB-dependent siderophore receptor n=1 Tax=Aliarcobacter butzleri TaxID=28197 RepID=UPI00287511BB|nr:TonB-dependent siderophore receptor [Aliarcobacter butzleri]MDS1315105.1 TonB-dependent siderophore receptor [Aliarcobacter butzleri]
MKNRFFISVVTSLILSNNVVNAKEISLQEAVDSIVKEYKVTYISKSNSLKDKKIDEKKINYKENALNSLNNILESNDLKAIEEDGVIYIIEKPKKTTNSKTTILEEISVNDKYLGSTTENSDSYTTGSMKTATKLDLSIRETPQSVMVISQQMLEDRKTDEFYTLIKKVTGVSVAEGFDGRATYYSRGFDLDYYLLDGLPVTQNWYTINNYNMDAYDRVEIVKGANGLMVGAGNPAVSINMIRKHANSKVFKGDIESSAGSWDMYKLKTDIQTPLNEDGSVRARLVASYKDKNSFVDKTSQENSLVYGVVDADITDNTTISAGASYEENNRDGIMGGGSSLPAFYSDGTKTNFSRSKSYMFDWSKWDTSITSYFTDVKHYFDNDILLNASYSHNEIHTKDRNFTNIQGSLNKDGSGLTAGYGKYPEKIKKDSIDIYASIPFELAKKEHEIIVGTQYNKENDKKYKPEFTGKYNITNYFTQDGSEFTSEPNMGRNILRQDADTEQKSVYLTGKFELIDDLKLIIGSRLTTWEYDSYSWDTNSRTKYDHDNIFTPFVGLVYDLDENHSIYTSYTDIFLPQGNVKDKSGNILDPKEGSNYEAGIKGEYFDKKLNAGLTLFRLEQDNVAESINGVFVDGSNGTEQAYKSMKGVTSKGIELEIGGEITDNWDISAGFTHFEAKDANKDKVNTTTPRNNINIFTKYTINDFSFGAGVNWKSKGYSKSDTREITQDAYAVVDLMASYKFNKNLSTQLNINNLFDKTYYIGYGTSSYNYGDPVNGILSLKYKF